MRPGSADINLHQKSAPEANSNAISQKNRAGSQWLYPGNRPRDPRLSRPAKTELKLCRLHALATAFSAIPLEIASETTQTSGKCLKTRRPLAAMLAADPMNSKNKQAGL